jgi:hypothetical protein
MNVDSQITKLTEIINDSNEDAAEPTATKVAKE